MQLKIDNNTQLNMKFVKTIILSLTLMTIHSSLSLSLNNNQHIPVFLAADDNYAPFVATTMASILKNTKSHIDFYVLSDGITAKNKVKIANERKWFKNFSLRFIDIDKKLEKLSGRNSLSRATFGRFFIPELVPSIKKVLYLDVDMIVKKDIKKLYDVDLDKYAFAAVAEALRIQKNCNDRLNKYFSAGIPSNHRYFNAGMLLINAEKWREERIKDKLMEIALKYSGDKNFLYLDQDALNINFANNYKEVNKIMNNELHILNIYLDEEKNNGITEAKLIDDTIVLHYSGGGEKPWLNNRVKYANEFWKIVPYTDFADEIKQIHDNSQRDMKIMQHIDRNAAKINKYVRRKVKLVYILLGVLIGLNIAGLVVLVRRRK